MNCIILQIRFIICLHHLKNFSDTVYRMIHLEQEVRITDSVMHFQAQGYGGYHSGMPPTFQ